MEHLVRTVALKYGKLGRFTLKRTSSGSTGCCDRGSAGRDGARRVERTDQGRKEVDPPTTDAKRCGNQGARRRSA
jgi:hypothetical protein